MEVTRGTLLNGRVRYDQFRTGYRTGIEPVLLAAAVPAQAGERVLEAGTGAGAGLLCLLWRVPGLTGIGIEADANLAALARRNLAANGLTAAIHTGLVGGAHGLGPFNHAFANPPWHDRRGTLPPDPRRSGATHRSPGGLAEWVEALSACLMPGGTLTLALPAGQVNEAAVCLQQAGLARITVIPLRPGKSLDAKIVLMQGRDGCGTTRLTSGLALHDRGRYTETADAILRGGGALTP